MLNKKPVFYMNRPKIKSTLLTALEQAGKVLKTSLSGKKVIEKKSELSLVTQIDKRAEKIIVSLIRKNFTDCAIPWPAPAFLMTAAKRPTTISQFSKLS